MEPARRTKDSILDAAEQLFSERGIEGVSLRCLTGRAGVNLASVHYHFGSKEQVVKAVFRRRVRVVNRRRIERLDRLERQGDPQLEEILAALFEPGLRLAADPERGRRFMRLGARIFFEPAKYMASLFEEEFAEVIRRFHAALHSSLPDLPPAELRLRMHFAIGMLVHTMLDTDRARNMTIRCGDPPSTRRILKSMVTFVAAGLRAPLSHDSPLTPRRPDHQ